MRKFILYFMILVLSGLITSAHAITIKGKVSDDQGNPLQGVSVSVKGSSTVVYTDLNGNYNIEAGPGDQALEFSFPGFEVQIVKISGRTWIDVLLKPAVIHLNEIIVPVEAERDQTAAVVHIRGTASVNEMRAFDKKEYTAYSLPAEFTQPVFNTEGYSAIHENGYKNVYDAPLSTFSIDVDKASWSNIRRFLNNGQLPPKDAVRIEEMINYFSYTYPEPEDEHPFSVTTELSVCPWNREHQLLHVGLKGMEIDREELPASNLVFLIDVSGSMNSDNKIGLLKSAFKMLVQELRAEDRVAIVVYAGAAGQVLEPTSGKEKTKINQAIERLSAGGSTAGGAGLQLAYKLASENYKSDGNNRIILATDGDFNVGASSNAEMERLIEKEREKGIYLTVLGFGMGNYKDDKMEILADKGNGNYAYIDNIQEARKVLVSEFGGTLFTIAKDVKFQLEFNPARVKAYRLIGYENRLLNDEDFNNDRKDAGEMGAGHTVTALYEIIPAGSREGTGSIDPLKYQENLSAKIQRPDINAELLTIKLRYKKPDGFQSILIEKPVKGEIINANMLSENFRFSAAVAEFGLILRDSEFRGNANIDQVVSLAESARGRDDEGYRTEFIKLVKAAGGLSQTENNR